MNVRRRRFGFEILFATAVVCGALADEEHSDRGVKSYNVREFGAMGDGTTKDAVAFQKALDV